MRLSPRRSKYGNRKTTVDGIVFDSAKEARRYSELLLREKAGEIYQLTRQIPIVLTVNGVRVCSYKPDFVYMERDSLGAKRIYEDCKGMRTQVYILKKKLVKALYGLEIRET